MKQKPSLLMLSFSWSLIIALLMTAISFMHNFQGELTDSASGRIAWSDVGFLFLAWFVAAEVVMLISGGLYFGVRSLFQRTGPDR
ncbi:MAG: hypothetical protein WBG92_21635 [Thiohalocapsa sp.]